MSDFETGPQGPPQGPYSPPSAQWGRPGPAKRKRSPWVIVACVVGGLILAGAVGNALDRDDENLERADREAAELVAPDLEPAPYVPDEPVTGGWESWQRSIFVDACTGDSATASQCGCMADELEAAYPSAYDLPDSDSTEGEQAVFDAALACLDA